MTGHYRQLHRQIQDLITNVPDERTGTPPEQIYDWKSEAQDCLSLLEDKMPTALSDFRGIWPGFEFIVDDDPGACPSKSAYRPTWINPLTGAAEGTMEELVDFRFKYLVQASGLLKRAVRKLEFEGFAVRTSGSAGYPPDEHRVALLNPVQPDSSRNSVAGVIESGSNVRPAGEPRTLQYAAQKLGVSYWTARRMFIAESVERYSMAGEGTVYPTTPLKRHRRVRMTYLITDADIERLRRKMRG
jgi:hypothetical protein